MPVRWRDLEANLADLHDRLQSAGTSSRNPGTDPGPVRSLRSGRHWFSASPERTVMGIMGWSSTGMTRRYQHVTDAIRQALAEQVDGLLWSEDPGAGEGDGGAADANRDGNRD